MTRLRNLPSILIPLLATASCRTQEARPFLPEGDAMAGREAFTELRCYVCHAVGGDTFPAPHASPPVPVELGPALATKGRVAVAEAIIAPSHRIPDDLEGVGSGTVSRMGDYRDAMTVGQWLDIIAYLETLAGRGAAP
jgi:hypothetical protein